MAEEGNGRPELDQFLADLRKLRERAGQPSLRVMARSAHYSHTALSGVLSGDRLPSLALTLAFVRACHGDEDEWRRRWNAARSSIDEAGNDATDTHPRVRTGRGRLIAIGSAGIVAAFAVLAGTMLALAGGPAKARPPAGHTALTAPTVSCPQRPDPGDHPLIPCDDDRFIADVTIPDGTIVRAGHTFVKTWEIQNSGLVPWQGRYLSRQGLLAGAGLCASVPQVAIPATLPGQDVRISVTFTAPSLPGSCRVDWKMTDGHGRVYFPYGGGLYVIVNVTG
jgi:Ig-like domain from next to BRCA1 gene/Helix-turn-helix domain